MLAGAFLGAGVAVHYSTAVYAVVLAFAIVVADAAGMTLTENLWKIAFNCFDTLVPHFLRDRPPLIGELMAQPNGSAVMRDWWFAHSS